MVRRIKSKKGLKFWFGIKSKLRAAFAVQLIIILILGSVTYQQSADIIIENYEKSTLTTLDIMAEHFSYILGTIESKVFEYSIREDIKEYVTGFLFDPLEKRSFQREFSNNLEVEIFNNSAIRSIRVMGDYGNVFSIERGQQNMTSFDRDFYKEYLSSKDLSGFLSKGEATGWYGAHPELDERTKQTISAYSLYYIRNIVDFRSNVGIVILDVSKQFVMEALKESNLPKGSTAAFITADGYETVYSEDADIPSIKESGFLHILEDEKDQNQGYYYGEYEGRKYMFLYSRVDISDSYFCALIPESIMTMQVEFLKVMTNIGILIGAVIAMAVGLSISRGFGNAITMTNEVLAKAAKGDLNVHIHQNRKDEFGTISENINNMLDTVRKATEQEKEAILKSKEAEIRSLEAQINPHFLYNTLDAINWVAIDQGALEASKMITNLADNLRYSIKNSNEVVTISREVEYLRKYLQLQQKRFRYLFECILDVDDEVMEEPIHKMLLQPLIENAIEHAFIGREDNNEIVISIKKSEKGLLIQVDDNGIGMNHDLVEQLNRYDYLKDRIESNIGLRNVATRLKMYYGEECHMHIDSSEKGTKISILIPY